MKPDYALISSLEYEKLTEEKLLSLKENAEAVFKQNADEQRRYWDKANSILKSIDEIFPVRKDFRKKRDIVEHSKLYKYAEKEFMSSQPHRCYLENREFKEFYEKIKKIQQQKADDKNSAAAAQKRADALLEKKVEEAKKVIKYTLLNGWDGIETSEEFIDKVESLDKYIYLGMAMMRVRNNWSEGIDGIIYALNSFSIDTEVDKDISDCVAKAIQNYGSDNDGRIFRDIKWNYNKLFELANQTWLKQYDDLIQYVDFY